LALNPLNTSLPNSPLVDSAGNITPVWRSWFLAMMARTGGTGGTDASGAATTTQLAAETAARASADTALTAGIAAETSARTLAVASEAATRAAADAYLGGAATAATTGAVALETAPVGFGTKISGMPTAGNSTGAELFPVVQAGANVSWSLNSLYGVLTLELLDSNPNPLNAASGSGNGGLPVLWAGGSGDGIGDGGLVQIQGGDGGDSGAGGDVELRGGNGGATLGDGGGGTMQAGNASAIGDGGGFTLAAGNGGGTSGSGGAFALTAGSAPGDGGGGSMSFRGGSGAGTGDGGLMQFFGGGSGFGATGAGGGLFFLAGLSNATDGDGGDITFQIGNGAGTGRTGLFVFNGMVTTDGAIPFSLWSDAGVLVQSGATLGAALGNAIDGVPAATLPLNGGEVAVVAIAAISKQTTLQDILNIGTMTAVSAAAASGDPGNPIILTAGAGDTNGDGGDITLTPGAGAGAGRNGQLVPVLPTADPTVTDAVWSDNGVLTQSGATLAAAFAAADLSALPVADPGGGLPWLSAGVLKVGP
jgi:hypothetical protein